jgi:hypothetical protein
MKSRSDMSSTIVAAGPDSATCSSSGSSSTAARSSSPARETTTAPSRHRRDQRKEAASRCVTPTSQSAIGTPAISAPSVGWVSNRIQHPLPAEPAQAQPRLITFGHQARWGSGSVRACRCRRAAELHDHIAVAVGAIRAQARGPGPAEAAPGPACRRAALRHPARAGRRDGRGPHPLLRSSDRLPSECLRSSDGRRRGRGRRERSTRR